MNNQFFRATPTSLPNGWPQMNNKSAWWPGVKAKLKFRRRRNTA